MAVDSQTIAAVLLSLSAAGLIWYILRLRPVSYTHLTLPTTPYV